MARPYWSGPLQISLVSFGVSLYVATESKSRISFHQISRSTGERVRHQRCSRAVWMQRKRRSCRKTRSSRDTSTARASM